MRRDEGDSGGGSGRGWEIGGICFVYAFPLLVILILLLLLFGVIRW